MKNRFAAIVGMVLIMASAVLPVRAASAAQTCAAVQTGSGAEKGGASFADLTSEFRYLDNGWYYRSGSWYYVRDGKAVTGWLKSKGHWYYLDANGSMRTGWLKLNGKEYYLDQNGVLDETKTRTAGADSAENSSSAKSKGEMIAQYALQFVGRPYVYGGCSLTEGTDCSGFVMLIYRHFGVSLPHYDAAIRTKGKSVDSLAEAKAGDIICYYGHVAIYLGDGRIVHASNSRDGIKITEKADYRQIVSIRRIFD